MVSFPKTFKMVNINELCPYDKNPKNHTDKDINLIIKSIEKNGWTEPILCVPETNQVLAGNGRLLAAKKMGLTEVPVIYAPENLTDEQKAYIVIASNKLVEVSGYNDYLGELIAEFDLELGDFGIEADMSMVEEMPKLKDEDKSPFQQITFTLADEQAEAIKSALEMAKNSPLFESNMFGNENRNGNALYVIVQEWLKNGEC